MLGPSLRIILGRGCSLYKNRIKSHNDAKPTVITKVGIPFLRKYVYNIGNPAESAMPTVIIVADAPINEPFPPMAAPMDKQKNYSGWKYY
jgi:hypothetical protein